MTYVWGVGDSSAANVEDIVDFRGLNDRLEWNQMID